MNEQDCPLCLRRPELRLRMYTLGQNLWLIVRLSFRGIRGYQRKEGLGYWYEDRRETDGKRDS